jgi:phage N-6-adenine-methyltransferase
VSYLKNLLDAKLKNLHTAADVQDEWRTPDLEFLGIQELYCPTKRFSIDLFTDGVINSKAKNFFTAKDNAIEQDWHKHCKEQGIAPFGFANPPFSKSHKGLLEDGSTCTGLGPIMKKAHIEMMLGFHSVFFVPNNTEADWFPHRLSEHPASAIYKLTNGRVSFDVPNWYKQDPEGSKPSSSRGGMSICIFDPCHNGKPIDDVVSRDCLREVGQRVLDESEAA